MSTITADPTAAESRPSRRPVNPFLAVVHAVASLKLTVGLFVAGVLLVFFGTLAQMNSGIWTVVDRYFWSEYVWVDLQLFVQFAQIFFDIPRDTHINGSFPFIGGRLLGFLMLVNLLAAHAVRFQFTWKRLGIWVTHLGLILLFVGEIGTRIGQVEQRMTIPQGGSADYAYEVRNTELAFTDPSDPAVDRVTVVPTSRLREAFDRKTRLTHPDLPVDIEVADFMVNSDLEEPKPGTNNPATAGLGLKMAAVPVPEVAGVSTGQDVDFPAAYLRLFKKGTDEPVGTYMVSSWLPMMKTQPRQDVEVDGKKYDLALRFARHYKPYRIELIEFRFDRYVGTQKAKNFSSRVRVIDPERGAEQEAVISMNNPLYYRGETYYQADFDKETEKTTVLQVVRNPVWWVPYVACGMVAGGMAGHFGMYLVLFVLRTVRRRPGDPAPARLPRVAELARPTTTLEKVLPWAVFGLCGLYLATMMLPRSTGRIDLSEVARLPVVDGGRVKPLDTYARVQLRLLTHKEEFEDTAGKSRPAIQWFLDVASATRQGYGDSAKYKVFRIENDQVLEVLGLKRREGLRYSLDEILSGTVGGKRRYDLLREEAGKAVKVKEKDRTVYHRKLLELRQHIGIFDEVWQGGAPLLLPPDAGRKLEWRTPAEADQKVSAVVYAALTKAAGRQITMEELKAMPHEEQVRLSQAVEEAHAKAEQEDPTAAAWRNVLRAYRDGERDKFDRAVRAYQDRVAESLPAADVRRVRFETFLNEFAPTWHTLGLYAFAALLTAVGWGWLAVRPGLAESFRRAAFWLLVLTFVVHAAALLSRMYLMDRPLVFVTNLYSSAVFIGCAAVGLGLVLERIFPLGLGNFVGAVIGFLTSIIAHNLAAAGDTLEMMVAVLDTNFWLATHVTCVTLGYSATYVAGFIGLMYVVLGVFTPVLNKTVDLGTSPRPVPVGRLLGMALYGVVCLATLLSFTGTVLGGIWADFSWGRFWGWDPKENGAVLIVIWNALILHARWGGMVKDRGMAALALVGNMITTWSWFGTNQLSVGLHNYGFSKALAEGCKYTWIVHLGLIGLAIVPLRYWGSGKRAVTAVPVGSDDRPSETEAAAPAPTFEPEREAAEPVPAVRPGKKRKRR